MDEISRRKLFLHATGALTAGVGFPAVGKGLLAVSPQSSSTVIERGRPSFSSGTESSPTAPGFGSENASDSYRLVSQESTQQRFGIVRDFFGHIEERADIKREILYWLTDGRSSFLGASGRFQFLEATIRPMYEAAGIPMEFGFGLGMQESLFRNYSISSARAKGIWQMQWAGRKYGLRGGDYFDIVKSTESQLFYLKDLVRDFDWNLELVLVDYNYGPGKKFSRYRSQPNAFRKIYHRLPQQTRRYVPRVLAAIALGLQPERYGMFSPRLNIRTVSISVPREIHHLELGLLLGTDHWNLGNLNPRENIRTWFKEGEKIKIPQTHERVYHERVNDHPLRDEFRQFVANVYPSAGADIKYVVKTGDNLSRIAGRFRDCGVQGPNHIMLYNGLTNTVIHPGQKLTIPCTD